MTDVLRLGLAALLLRTVGAGLRTSRTGAHSTERPISGVGVVRIDSGGRGEEVVLEIASGLHRVLPLGSTLQILLCKVLVGFCLADVVANIIVNLEWNRDNFSFMQ